ncbi:MAG: hypothetical protein OEU74_00730 [Gammaproteobacteria bacterium]|nr:hypothetical protein [Gammaproteobacteria bacterium]
MEQICPFGSTLVTETCRCVHADQVVRRGGAEIVCQAETAYVRCTELFQHLKNVALPEFEVEDDLTTMPHSVLQKIQFGGLLGLQQLITGQVTDTVADIADLLDALESKYGTLEELPYNDLVSSITEYKLKRRRGRG